MLDDGVLVITSQVKACEAGGQRQVWRQEQAPIVVDVKSELYQAAERVEGCCHCQLPGRLLASVFMINQQVEALNLGQCCDGPVAEHEGRAMQRQAQHPQAAGPAAASQ